jgi:hypothetical protein
MTSTIDHAVTTRQVASTQLPELKPSPVNAADRATVMRVELRR